MTVRAQCPGCGNVSQVPRQALGRQGRCKKCETRFTLASARPEDAFSEHLELLPEEDPGSAAVRQPVAPPATPTRAPEPVLRSSAASPAPSPRPDFAITWPMLCGGVAGLLILGIGLGLGFSRLGGRSAPVAVVTKGPSDSPPVAPPVAQPPAAIASVDPVSHAGEATTPSPEQEKVSEPQTPALAGQGRNTPTNVMPMMGIVPGVNDGSGSARAPRPMMGDPGFAEEQDRLMRRHVEAMRPGGNTRPQGLAPGPSPASANPGVPAARSFNPSGPGIRPRRPQPTPSNAQPDDTDGEDQRQTPRSVTNLAAPHKVVPFLGHVTQVAVGAGGKRLFLGVSDARIVHEFDPAKGVITRSYEASFPHAIVAAGASKLVVLSVSQRILQRWDIATGRLEVTTTLASQNRIGAIAIGASSSGPLWVLEGGLPQPYDLGTLEPLWKPEPTVEYLGRLTRGDMGLRACASADGRVLGYWDPGIDDGRRFRSVIFDGSKLDWSLGSATPGHTMPDASGQVFLDADGRYGPDGHTLDHATEWPRDYRYGDFCLPTAEPSPFYLKLQVPASGDTKHPFRIAIHSMLDSQQVVDLDGRGSEALGQSVGDTVHLSDRFWYFPSAKSLVVLPFQKSGIHVYPFDVDAALEKSGQDYLVAASDASRWAKPGGTYIFRPVYRSRKGDVKISLQQNPPGMSMGPDGTISWKVPPDLAGKRVSVILGVRDASSSRMASYTIQVESNPDADRGQGRTTFLRRKDGAEPSPAKPRRGGAG